MPGLWARADSWYNRDVQIPGHRLIRAGKAWVNSEFFGSTGKLFRWLHTAWFHVFFPRMEGTWIMLQVYVVRVRKSTSIIWTPEWVSTAQGWPRWGLWRRDIRVHCPVVPREASQCRVWDKITAVRGRTAPAQSLHAFVCSSEFFFSLHVKQCVRPASTQNQRNHHGLLFKTRLTPHFQAHFLRARMRIVKPWLLTHAVKTKRIS